MPPPRSQTGRSYEAGTEWHRHNTTLGLQLYQLSLDNEIAFDPSAFVNTNIGDSRRRGVVAEANQQITDAWHVNANLSYLDHEITSGSFDGSAIPLVASRTAAINSGYRFNRRLSAYYELIGISSRRLGADFSNSASRLPGYAISNVNLGYEIARFKLNLRVNNLFDKDYSDNGNFSLFGSPQETFFPAPGRNYLLTIRYNYE